MFIEMLLKTWPRNWRAAVALVVLLSCLSRGLTTVSALVMPGKDDVGSVILGLVALVVGLAAAVAFYYFQSNGNSPQRYSELETLDKYHQAERYKHAKATPVFSSHEGAIGTPKDESQQTGQKPN
jgi:hypothetical protein